MDYSAESASLTTAGPPVLVGKFPHAQVANFQLSPSGDVLVFSAEVYSDRNLSTVKEQDDKWNNRGSSALVYYETYVRHWDSYRLPKSHSLLASAYGKVMTESGH